MNSSFLQFSGVTSFIAELWHLILRANFTQTNWMKGEFTCSFYRAKLSLGTINFDTEKRQGGTNCRYRLFWAIRFWLYLFRHNAAQVCYHLQAITIFYIWQIICTCQSFKVQSTHFRIIQSKEYLNYTFSSKRIIG